MKFPHEVANRILDNDNKGNNEKILTKEEFKVRFEQRIREKFIPLEEAIPGIDTTGLVKNETYGLNPLYYDHSGGEYKIESRNPLAYGYLIYLSQQRNKEKHPKRE